MCMHEYLCSGTVTAVGLCTLNICIYSKVKFAKYSGKDKHELWLVTEHFFECSVALHTVGIASHCGPFFARFLFPKSGALNSLVTTVDCLSKGPDLEYTILS